MMLLAQGRIFMHRWIAIALGLVYVLTASAQAPETYKVRLAPVAIDAAMKAVIAGEGTFTATLTGTKFTLNGTFTGMKSNATLAHIHQGTAPGGEVSGTFDLTPEQIENLHKGRWYVQIHSEKAPAGNLWGWLIK